MTWQYAVSLLLLFYDSLIKDHSEWCTIDCSFLCIYFSQAFWGGNSLDHPLLVASRAISSTSYARNRTDCVPQPLFSALSMIYVMPCLFYFFRCVLHVDVYGMFHALLQYFSVLDILMYLCVCIRTVTLKVVQYICHWIIKSQSYSRQACITKFPCTITIFIYKRRNAHTCISLA